MASSATKALIAIKLTLALAILNLGSHSVVIKASHVSSCSARATMVLSIALRYSKDLMRCLDHLNYCQIQDFHEAS